MSINHFERMTRALSSESQSPHPTHKVGALICGHDQYEQYFEVSRPNFWPDILEQHFAKHHKLGNASTTVHAEIATIYDTPATDGASIYITDLPCPNCCKMIAESKITNVYIDSHTHQTPLGIKMKPYFDKISTTILTAANINTYEINLQTETIKQLITASETTLRPIHRPLIQTSVDVHDVSEQSFHQQIQETAQKNPYAACYAKTPLGQYRFILANAHRSTGLSEKQAQDIANTQNKYEPTLQPINRLILACARYGLTIEAPYLYSSQTPTSREFVNMIGAGYTNLQIGDKTQCRDKYGLAALAQLTKNNIIAIEDAPL
ncbi:MAG: hypothetical protein ACRBDL_01030 [Alphaproteobacteria bacterium]